MRGLRQLAMTLGAVLVVVGALGTAPAVLAAAGRAPEAAAESSIQIVQTPSGGGGGGFCLPPVFAMRQSTRSDATTFRLIIEVTAPICSRVNAVAAIYKMPGNGVAWPQTLLETAPFTLREPGTTEVIFTKTCTPAQFDVITGATPPVISPTGAWHGPLLFPFDTSTSFQWFGCGPTTSTSTTNTTSSSTTTTIDDNCENYTPTNVTVTPTVVRAGGSITVSGTGTPGTRIEVLLQPPAAADAAEMGLSAAESRAGFVAMADPALVQPDGTWSTTLIVPDGAQSGQWTVSANAVGCDATVTSEVTVTGASVVSSTPSTEGPVVAGETVSNTVAGDAAADPAQVAGLAFTGTSVHLPILAGVALITGGGLLLLSSRRRRAV